MKNLREEMKATEMKFTVTGVDGCGHTDTWTSASMTGQLTAAAFCCRRNDVSAVAAPPIEM